MEVPAGMQQLKDRMRSTWMAGDFGRIASYTNKIAEDFVEGLNVVPGMNVLDVACGTGNTALPAARKGAHVTGVDIAPNLLEQARERASAEGLTAKFDEGDAENLPYRGAQYDLVISMFGAMFAPRPEQVAAELGRVCRPGGRIAMANWTPDGLSGKMFALTARHIPPPEGIPAPVLWGDEGVVRKRLKAIASRIDTAPRTIEMEFPFPPRGVVQLFREYFGPTQVAFSRLDPSQQEAYAADLEKMWSEHNESGGGTTLVRNEYLEVIATRA
jgi:ubiquinone/menaquinone biosynthesis C-methylase UbiE